MAAPSADAPMFTPVQTTELFPAATDGPFLSYLTQKANYYASIEALFIQLSDPKDQPVAQNSVTNETVMSTSSTGYGFSPGYRFTLGYAFSDVASIEGTYFGINGWKATATASGNDDLRIPGNLALATDDYFGARQVATTSKSNLNNAELNYLRATGYSGVSVLAGFRYLNFNETFNLNSSMSSGQSSDYEVKSRNNLYGVQLGLHANRDWGDWSFNLTGKGGLFGNSTQQNTTMGDDNNSIYLRNSTTNAATTSFVGDVGVNAVYRFNPIWGVRAGYSVMWMNNVARAADQLDFTNTPSSGTGLNSHSNAFLQGVNVGVEANW
jgi:hypothetical protein